jgi:hypothetical protein
MLSLTTPVAVKLSRSRIIYLRLGLVQVICCLYSYIRFHVGHLGNEPKRTLNGANWDDIETYSRSRPTSLRYEWHIPKEPFGWSWPRVHRSQVQTDRHRCHPFSWDRGAILPDRCRRLTDDQQFRMLINDKRTHKDVVQGGMTDTKFKAKKGTPWTKLTSTPPYRPSPLTRAAAGRCSPGYVWFGRVPTSQESYAYGHWKCYHLERFQEYVEDASY